ncbi:MAG: sulfurtransferase [Flavobacteriales bacterium CG03_land_8_20_14_0_80_35_15]|nr:YeeE/YedE family protein [Zetaproteobacteria bacterium]NDK17423.1 YeeE/YedE family protein [Flavobacteriales bacterium]OIO12690.1 MAG: sulfurtransferase [Flavobacteriaceae bacterium CG1_02_35_72]PIV16143.1 MAG: sulfurtransferase [Flavobacteriales bacterium CG03_land_8_20_14_0_80_35_15]PIX05994.1 MAG: sulfurtransferase [Flavobacteriales bacterium CG_4_8_14_3_um_filter_35_10]PJA04671.1 MAG: sulfurtransferase [Flavobacteriales bacterium CG_4_10_14_0_2_um_filter_35_18]
MGPLIPNGIIPPEWDFVIALLIGIIFGYVLEASGFSSSRKLAGVFYGYDFVVLKVFFTAAVVAVIGIYYLDYLGFIDISKLYIHPTYLWAAIVGGIVMGLGFILGGFCPGTSLCAVAIGKIDAMAYGVGILIGVFIFSEFFSFIQPLFDGSNYGAITLVDTLGISPYWFIFLFSLVAIIAFVISDLVRKKVKKIFY